jgi:hypothetical protein
MMMMIEYSNPTLDRIAIVETRLAHLEARLETLTIIIVIMNLAGTLVVLWVFFQ